MAPLPYVPSVCRVALKYRVGNDLGAGSRIFAKYSGPPPSAADLNTWAAAAFTALAGLAPLTGPGKNYLGVVIQDLSSDVALEGVASGNVLGTRAGLDMAAETCATFAHTIARHYRGGKPKAYMPLGVAGDLYGEQAWNPAFIAAAQAGWNTFLAAVMAGAPSALAPVAQVNVSYYQGSSAYDVGSGAYVRGKTRLTHRAGGPIVDPVTASLIQTRLGSQRRRNL